MDAVVEIINVLLTGAVRGQGGLSTIVEIINVLLTFRLQSYQLFLNNQIFMIK